MIRIILVADDPNSAREIQNRLQRVSYDVIATTATADEVITRVDELRPDVILVDVRLKGETDEIEAARQIKSFHDIPIIFITAGTDEATARRAIAAEPDGFLIKPLDELELLAAIDIATKKHQKERQARLTNSRLREITDALAVVTYETDATGRITFVNATAFDLFGYTKEELEAGMSIFQLIVPADREQARTAFRRREGGEDVDRMEYTVLRKDGSTRPISTLGAPIRRDGAVVGVRGIAVDITERKQADAAVAWESAIKSSVARLYTPLIAPTSSLEDIALAILKEAKHLTGSEDGFVAHIDPSNTDLVVHGLAQMTPEECAIPEEKRQNRFPMGPDGSYPSLWGYALNTKKGFYTNAPATHPASRGTPDGHSLLAQLLAAPALVADRVVGIIELANPGRDYTERDLKAVERLADVYALAAVRTRADERVREHTHTIEILNLIVTEGSRTTDVQSFAETVTNLTLELLHFDVGTIHLVDDDARCAKLRYATGIPDIAVEAIRRIPLDEAPYARFLVEPKPLFIDGHEASRVPHVAELGLESLAVVPLYRYDESIGALTFGSFKRHTFSQAEKELLIAIGSEAGTVIAELQADEALKESERRIREITDTLPVVVYEADETSRVTFVNATAFDMFGYTKEELEAGMSILQVVTDADEERARTVFRRRMSGEDVGRVEYTGRRKDGNTFPISIHTVLMRRDGAVVGLRGIIVDITERKRAEERVRERTHTIEILNHIMTEGNRAASVQPFAETVTNLTLELLHFDAGTIHLVDDDARCANLRYATGIPDTAVEAIRKIPLDEAPYARFLVEPKPLFVDGYEASRVPHVAELGLESLAVVPLYRYDESIGALNVGSFKRHTFSQAEKELLIAIGSEAGVVIAKLQADELIRAALKERETLLKEIHHRVKNNMQVVSSLLSLQAAQATERETIETLNESQRQIRSMALIHEKLYSSGSLSEVDFGDYVESLIAELLRMYNVPLGVITITTDIENVQLGVDTAIPCALIINELMSNSLKYAFPDGRTGAVTVALERANGVHTLTVADDGVGFPADVDFRATDSLGMQLVVTLVGQLEGTITLDRTKGTTFVITFKPAGDA